MLSKVSDESIVMSLKSKLIYRQRSFATLRRFGKCKSLEETLVSFIVNANKINII